MTPTMTAALTNLSRRINAEHAACEAAMKAGLQHAVNAGRLLNEAKGLCGHGGWGAWIAGHFAGSARTAQTYMRVASRLPELESKAQRVADLSLREAAKLLAEVDATEGAATEPGEGTEGEAAHAPAARVLAAFTIDEVMDRLKYDIAKTWQRCPPEFRSIIAIRIISLGEEIQSRGGLPWVDVR